jgi:DMSO/TMAO reductase YedYZ molybdopterin-dependent catalytic subunit
MTDDEIKIDEVRELASNDVWPGGRENTANIVGETRELSEPMSEADAKRAMFRRSRRGFIVSGAAALIGVLGWRWMPDETKYKLLRGTLEFNEWVSQNLYSSKRLAPEFARDRVSPERVNGMLGIDTPVDTGTWKLTIAGLGIGETSLSLEELRSLPRTEMTTEFKCIEGWSVIVNWAGVRVSDLVKKYGDQSRLPRYVSMSTPDSGYFVGWDIESIMHPQTLLAYEMNGKPLASEHGAPLRLASPLKYGIKQIKRIGRIEFTNERPRDYWAEQGYDWYAGH